MGRTGRKQFCNHYRALATYDTCEVGIPYISVASRVHTDGKTYPDFGRLPCISGHENAAPCDKCQYPTAEEIAAHDADIHERFGRIGKIRAAIVQSLGGPWKKGMMGASGSVTCPCCGGNVRFSRAGYNGHIHATCSTADCASWME